MRVPDTSSPRGLYDPAFEHDACGVGFLCKIDGTPSHDIVHRGLEMLFNLEHRGACGCDERTGDGAGILIQVPHAFFKKQCGDLSIRLPEPGAYGVGMVFLPKDRASQRFCKARIEEVARAEGQLVLGWRRVPTRNRSIGAVARAVEPSIWQVFLGRGAGLPDQEAFERKLYVIRKVVQHTIHTTDLPDGDPRIWDSTDALELVEISQEDPFAGPADPALIATQAPQPDDLYDPAFGGVAAEHALDWAKRIRLLDLTQWEEVRRLHPGLDPDLCEVVVEYALSAP